MGTTHREGTCISLLLLYSFIMLAPLFRNELVIGLSMYCSQIPYEYLTPLQAAVGVVQKVNITCQFSLLVLFVRIMFRSGILTQLIMSTT